MPRTRDEQRLARRVRHAAIVLDDGLAVRDARAAKVVAARAAGEVVRAEPLAPEEVDLGAALLPRVAVFVDGGHPADIPFTGAGRDKVDGVEIGGVASEGGIAFDEGEGEGGGCSVGEGGSRYDIGERGDSVSGPYREDGGEDGGDEGD